MFAAAKKMATSTRRAATLDATGTGTPPPGDGGVLGGTGTGNPVGDPTQPIGDPVQPIEPSPPFFPVDPVLPVNPTDPIFGSPPVITDPVVLDTAVQATRLGWFDALRAGASPGVTSLLLGMHVQALATSVNTGAPLPTNASLTELVDVARQTGFAVPDKAPQSQREVLALLVDLRRQAAVKAQTPAK